MQTEDTGIVVPERIVDPQSRTLYTRGKLLGEGGFAKVFQANTGASVTPSAEQLAVKVVTKSSIIKAKAKSKLMSEIRIHLSLSHPNIVGFRRCFDDEINFYMVLELCENRTLLELVKDRKQLTEAETKYYLVQLLAAVQYLHSRHVIHRDLKLGNLFLNKNLQIKIGDFGLATVVEFEGERKKTICGTPNYIAPEILDNNLGHSYEVDIWSIGVILYTMLVGKPPFQTKDIKSTYKKIRTNDYNFPPESKISREAITLIRHLLHPDPAQRASLDEIYSSSFLNSGYIPNELPLSSLHTEPLILAVVPRQDRSQRVALENAPVASDPNELASSLAAISINDKKTVQETSKAVISSSAEVAPTLTNVSPSSGKENIVSKRVQSAKPPVVQPTQTSSSPKPTSLNMPAVIAVQQQQQVLTSVSASPVVATTPTTPMVAVHQMPAPVTADGGSLLLMLAKRLNKLFDESAPTPSASNPMASASASSTGSGLVHLWIGKWVDYANKYGLGYELTSGAFGVFFNDNTSMVLQLNETIEYWDPKTSVSNVQNYTAETVPSSLQKKWTLLQHFKEYMLKNLTRDPVKTAGDDLRLQLIKHARVTKWIRSKKAVLFRLSHGVVQINFLDHGKLVLASDGEVLYIDENRDVKLLNLTALEASKALVIAGKYEDAEIVRRIRYAREILVAAVSGSTTATTATTVTGSSTVQGAAGLIAGGVPR